MNIEDLNFKIFSEKIEESVSTYVAQLDSGIEIRENIGLHLTPDKPNSARSVIQLNAGNTLIGELYVILFMPNDGTGDSNTYELSDILIPKYLQFAIKPERIIPRAKKGIFAEFFFPFFSFIGDSNSFIPNAICLDELILEEG